MREKSGRWAVVVLALIGAALACAVEFSTAHLENAVVVADPQGGDRVRTFGPTDEVYVVAELRDAPEPIDVAAVWYELVLDDEDDVVEMIEIDRDEETTANAQLVFHMTPPDADQEVWPRGEYRVELFVDGDQVEQIDFPVR